ncbi:type 1 glutamine amidotransferase domain-containing protein [Arsukibacterium sp.]|uniref:type 1 glutamine amidotransferase domain-containing protein n=1 Tax=Arsukibacterium sp. TaxID=1977258 RepID=UPI00299D8E9F|nr:type 1 glutamine amidotransferase domain-containing protein [Arsukibacterium sp.]MDX1678393.1 type 1 glutamine amidotransferase domain-containing protein [Arsukibacterium sp.]
MNNPKPLAGKKVAILATNGFEQSELTSPRDALLNAGAEVDIVSQQAGTITGWSGKDWAEDVKVDKTLADVNAKAYDGLVLPGGLINPDTLRQDKQAINFIKGFFSDSANKPVAAICHGPWLLAEAGVIKGRKVTSYGSIRTDLKNAGADWVDEAVVVDNGLVTSRNPDDLPAFNRKVLEEIREGRHQI